MGMGNSNRNQVYFDAETGQYYTLGKQGAYGGYGSHNKNYINGLNNNSTQAGSMVTSGMQRAQDAYNAALASLSTNPAYNQSAMFSGLSNPISALQSIPTLGLYGAGRFLSPAAAQATGGVLGLNFSTPGTTTK